MNVQVVQVFLLYFCPESVPLLGTFSNCLWFPFCRCKAEGPEAKEQGPSQRQQPVMPSLSRGASTPRLGGAMLQKVKPLLLAGKPLLAEGHEAWLGLREGGSTSSTVKTLPAMLGVLVVYGQCGEKM